jgi:hypothetical protein
MQPKTQTDKSVSFAVWNSQLIQLRFPIGGHPSGGSRYGLACGMRMRRKQFRTFDHRPRFVIVEPILARLEAGNDRMSRRFRVLGGMLTRRTVAASDVPTLRTPAEMKPPAVRRSQAFYASIAARLRSRINSAPTLLHFDLPFWRSMSAKEFKVSAKSFRHYPFLPLPEPRPLY